MDKNLFEKSSKFFKREGFYVILFVCLCVVATVAAITARNNKAVKEPTVVKQNNQSSTNDVALNNPSEAKTEVPNALEVKNNSQKTTNVPKEGASSAAVSKSNDFKFVKPVEGTLARGYTTDLVLCETIGTYKTNHGIEIQAKIDSPVSAVLDGKVETVDNDGTELGKYIVINHQNGLKTIYSNLGEDVNVKVGDTVKKGQQIGKVGSTRGSYSDEKFGSHLHFEVISGKDYVDPAKYISYTVAKQ